MVPGRPWPPRWRRPATRWWPAKRCPTSDVTPEATLSVCDREVPGIGQRMRAEGMKKTPLAALSRAVCGTRGACLVLNLPGSPRGATESLAAVIDVLPHALDLLAGKTAHSESSGGA